MNGFSIMIEGTMAALKTEFTLLGATFSYWQVFLWTVFIGIVVYIISEIWGN